MSRYTDRYRTPSPLFPKQSPTTLARLLDSWETLRALDTHGYRTSAATPASTWLVKIGWAEGHTSGRSQGRGTTCSPFVTQSVAMAYSSSASEPYQPLLEGGTGLPNLFSSAANGALRADNRCHQRLMERYGLTMADNEWPRPIIFFNMGYAVELEQMRRGDAVHIDWMNGGGHAVFCWDVHLNDRGEVDAFLYVSSNGSMADGGSGGGVSVGGTSKGAGGFIGSRSGKLDGDAAEYFAQKSPLFVDDERYVVEGAWVTWDDAVAGKLLTDMRARPKTKVKKAKRVKAARFFGVDVSQIPLFAMGQDAPGPFTPKKPDDRVPEINTPRISGPDDIAALQRRLKLLFLIGWSKADPGGIDGKAGKKTTAALVAFQRANGLSADGKPNGLTLTKLEGIFRSAFDDPKAKKYLDPSRASGLTFADSDWEDSAHLYFRHGVVSAEEPIDLILAGENLPQQPLAVTLINVDTRETLSPKDCALAPVGDRATLSVTLPRRAVGCRVIARLADSEIETGAPLFVMPQSATPAS
jgi:hypothetical protein